MDQIGAASLWRVNSSNLAESKQQARRNSNSIRTAVVTTSSGVKGLTITPPCGELDDNQDKQAPAHDLAGAPDTIGGGTRSQ